MYFILAVVYKSMGKECELGAEGQSLLPSYFVFIFLQFSAKIKSNNMLVPPSEVG